MNQASQPIPLAMTVIDSAWLAKEISTRYSLEPITHCYLLRVHLSHFYIAQSSKRRFAVRVSLGDWRSADQTSFELSFLHHLKDNKIPAVVPLANNEGTYFFELWTADGRRVITVFEWVTGTEVNIYPYEQHLYRLGEITAEMHNASATFSAADNISHSLEHGLKSWVPLILPYLNGRDGGAKLIISLTEKVKDYLPQLSPDVIPWSVVHGDLHAGNALLNESNEIILLDFDLCGAGPLAYDIASYIWASEKIGVPKNLESHFYSGYGAVRKLTAAEKEALPMLIVAKSIWWLALRALLVQQLGSTVFSPRNIDQFLFRLRRDADNAALELKVS